jgi:hypothetical protein
MSAFDWIHTSDNVWIRKQDIKFFLKKNEGSLILVGDTHIATKEKVDDIARQMGLKKGIKYSSVDGFKIDHRFLCLRMVGPNILNKLHEMHDIKTVEELDKRIGEVTEKTFNNLITQFKEAKKNNDWRWHSLNERRKI